MKTTCACVNKSNNANECVNKTIYKWMCHNNNIQMNVYGNKCVINNNTQVNVINNNMEMNVINNIQMNAYSAILQAHSALLKTKQRNYKVTYWHKLLRLSLIKRPYGGSETREGWVGWECMLTFHILSQHIFSYSPARNHTLFSPLSQPRQQTPGAHAILPV